MSTTVVAADILRLLSHSRGQPEGPAMRVPRTLATVTAAAVMGAILFAAPASADSDASPVEPVTVQADVVEDSTVVRVSPDTSYGSKTQMSARGMISPLVSFLRFALPKAPPGTVLSKAVLNIRTSTDPAAGSVDPHTVRLLDGGQWSESTVTWNTRPANLGVEMGILARAPAINTPYTVALDPTRFSGLMGTSPTLVMTTTGGDDSRWWSTESPYVPYRPVLTLTFEEGDRPPANMRPPRDLPGWSCSRGSRSP